MSLDAGAPPGAQDPGAAFLNSATLDLLLIELVPAIHRLAAEGGTAAEGTNAGGPAAKADSGQPTSGASAAAEDAASTAARGFDDDDARDVASRRLEAVGYRVGQGIAERFSRDRPRSLDTLDVIKFLCKDVWMLVFRKQVDNLKTNHRGVYVLTDNAFRPLQRMSTTSSSDATARAAPFLWFPCGVIRGALSSMGVTAVVQAETPDLPSAVFQIKTVGSKA